MFSWLLLDSISRIKYADTPIPINMTRLKLKTTINTCNDSQSLKVYK